MFARILFTLHSTAIVKLLGTFHTCGRDEGHRHFGYMHTGKIFCFMLHFAHRQNTWGLQGVKVRERRSIWKVEEGTKDERDSRK